MKKFKSSKTLNKEYPEQANIHEVNIDPSFELTKIRDHITSHVLTKNNRIPHYDKKYNTINALGSGGYQRDA